MGTDRHYTTQLGAGLGMVQETLALLSLWRPGTTPSHLVEEAVEAGIFSRATARRTRNLVMEMFAPRYLADEGRVAARLKFLQANRFPLDGLAQIFFLQTARTQRVFGDFVKDVYWTKYAGGSGYVSKEDAERFVHQALESGKMTKRWSEEMIDRVSGYVLGCCADFGLLAGQRKREYAIQRFSIRHEVALYVAYDLRFSGLSDMGVVDSHDWRLFGMDRQDVIRLLKTLGNDRHLLIQTSADLVQISWTYKTIEECLNVLTQR